MKNICSLFIATFFLLSCSGKQNSSEEINTESSGIKKQAIELSVEYIKTQFKDSTKTTSGGGVIWINDAKKMVEIDPARIYLGAVDADSTEDAIVTITSFFGKEPGIPEHLILLTEQGKLVLAKAIEMDMEILSLKDRILTGKIHTKPRTSPLYNCPECVEIVKYKFSNNDLVKME